MSQFGYYRPNAMPPVVKNLIIINALVFLAQYVFDRYGMEQEPQWTLTSKLALFPIGAGFVPYQVATHMFTHGSIMHILFNMFGLWTFGKMLENIWGPKRFLFFYLASGVGAAAVHLLVQYITRDYALAVGASGAVMGIFAAFAFLFPNTELFLMFIPFPVKAKWLVLIMAAYDLIGGLGVLGGTGIAHFAHLGGALTGFLIVLAWQKTNRRRFY